MLALLQQDGGVCLIGGIGDVGIGGGGGFGFGGVKEVKRGLSSSLSGMEDGILTSGGGGGGGIEDDGDGDEKLERIRFKALQAV